MSCKYCVKEKVERYNEDILNKNFEQNYILALLEKGKLYIEDNYDNASVEIRYCPMCGEELNPNGITIQHMKLSDTHYNKLVDKYDKETVDEVIESMKNYGKLKKYKNAYLTANKWCKKRFKDKSDGWGDVE